MVSWHSMHFTPSGNPATPLVKLGQADKWAPDPSPQTVVCDPQKPWAWLWCELARPGFLRWFRRGQICAGWVLATLFVAGVTGIVRKE